MLRGAASGHRRDDAPVLRRAAGERRHEAFLGWVCREPAVEGKKVFARVRVNAAWHVNRRAQWWVRPTTGW